ncbi:MAG: hypothetical protein Solumvirus5_10 [Solumvirus sp.]|uniref:Uncharacterized protein n=1 Tax=Solumvirus sp. TaxID=2487773 RepID=A0A3G5AJU6_9VIRU|nr:MAG: hypothetical protein Solumvirus5_10 [Solumvirus sp.]
MSEQFTITLGSAFDTIKDSKKSTSSGSSSSSSSSSSSKCTSSSTSSCTCESCKKSSSSSSSCSSDSSSSSTSSSECTTDSSSSSTCDSSSSSSKSSKKCDGKRPTAVEIYKKYNAAVVSITSEILLTPTAAPTIPPAGRYSSIFLVGNGVFVRDHHIVCPSSLVLIPPEQLANNNRYPYVSSSQPAPTGITPNVITSVSRILVQVNNVNNKPVSYTYKADLIGVDGAGDIAFLRINPKDPYNVNNPVIHKSHPRLRWGKSRDLTPGEKIYSFGDYTRDATSQILPIFSQPMPAEPGFIEGVVSNNKTLDYVGMAQQELLLVQLPVEFRKVGMPLINDCGELVGIQTLNFEQGMVAGPTEFFLRRALTAFMCPKKYANHLTTIVDANGSYLSYVKAYAGLAWRAVTARTLGTTIDPVTGLESVRIDTTTGLLSTLPAQKQVIGVEILGIAGYTGSTGSPGSYINLPGASGSPASGTHPAFVGAVNSPFLGILFPGDIITHINGKAIGGGIHQVTPATVTWALTSGSIAEIVYRKASDIYASINKAIVALAAYPPAYDYPYETIDNYASIPAIVATPVNQFQQPF